MDVQVCPPRFAPRCARSGQLVGFPKFEDAVQEVFAVSALPGIPFPDVLSGNDAHVCMSYALPEEALAEAVWPPQTV